MEKRVESNNYSFVIKQLESSKIENAELFKVIEDTNIIKEFVENNLQCTMDEQIILTRT